MEIVNKFKEIESIKRIFINLNQDERVLLLAYLECFLDEKHMNALKSLIYA